MTAPISTDEHADEMDEPSGPIGLQKPAEPEPYPPPGYRPPDAGQTTQIDPSQLEQQDQFDQEQFGHYPPPPPQSAWPPPSSEQAHAGFGEAPAPEAPQDDQPGAAPSEPATPGHLRFEDGTVVEVGRRILVGREPTAAAQEMSGDEESPVLVELSDPKRSLSRVHAEVRLEGQQVYVTDRNSTNGTYVEPPEQNIIELSPGEPFPISPGTRVYLGDGPSFVFERDQ
jgi:hypothetical protein